MSFIGSDRRVSPIVHKFPLSNGLLLAHSLTKVPPSPRQTSTQLGVESISNPKSCLARINDHEVDLAGDHNRPHESTGGLRQQRGRQRGTALSVRHPADGKTRF